MVRRLQCLVALLAVFALAACGSSSGKQIGLPSAGNPGFAIVGRIDQSGTAFIYYGYLTSINGLDSAQLFAPGTSPAERGEANALFTFHGTADLTGRSILENLFTIESDGGFSIFYSDQPSGAHFDDPTSFTKGSIVASVQADGRNLIIVSAPNTGLDITTATLTQTGGDSFKIGSDDFSFGAKDAVWRLNANGSGTRLEPTAPTATLNISGEAIVVKD